jgi:hypothetical protein
MTMTFPSTFILFSVERDQHTKSTPFHGSRIGLECPLL